MDIRTWLKLELEKSGKTQLALARHLKRGPDWVSLLLSAKRKLTYDDAVAIARFIPVNLPGPVEPTTLTEAVVMAEDWPERFLRRIEELRLTDVEVCRKAGVRPNTIADIKRGARPSVDKMAKLARAVNCSLNQLYTGTEKSNEASNPMSPVSWECHKCGRVYAPNYAGPCNCWSPKPNSV